MCDRCDKAQDYDRLKSERDRLQVWKDEASPILMGLQDLGRALGLPLGASITGPMAVAAASAMRAELQRYRDERS